MRSGHVAEIEHEIEVFATGTTVIHVPADEPLAEALRLGVEHALDFHARPGYRPGGAVAEVTSERQGGDTDIVRPVLVDPRDASRLALSGALFSEPIPHLCVSEIDRDDVVDRALVWDVTLSVGRRCRRRATLHLLASPSLLVTVLELVPTRPVRRHRDRYVECGIACVEVLARRLEQSRHR